MKLHKWNSNSKELFNSSTDQKHSFSTNAESAIKTLGVSWETNRRLFHVRSFNPFHCILYKTRCFTHHSKTLRFSWTNSKSAILVISKSNIFLQKLWLRKLNCEECLPEAIAPEWFNYVPSLKALEELKIDRYLLTDSYEKLMPLGYTDASESAYGTVVYMHCVKEDGTTTTKLIASKIRVVTIKVISIPRLELSACLLMAQLVEKVCFSL
ncbi:uncharacterized protein TNCT_180381 [Trichonephila clavata]|uniref:Uncharacterized protein n=1 Tax=Trichonephila clavata TaxID=2740835 RepID=A0A8X6HQ85_TRICU|nr:uncharacterized protein TNCT_180381 [Trichonephila clavata]